MSFLVFRFIELSPFLMQLRKGLAIYFSVLFWVTLDSGVNALIILLSGMLIYFMNCRIQYVFFGEVLLFLFSILFFQLCSVSNLQFGRHSFPSTQWLDIQLSRLEWLVFTLRHSILFFWQPLRISSDRSYYFSVRGSTCCLI